MNLERFKQVEEIFNAVIALPPAERISFLEQSCGDDEALRSEVESLLSFDETYASVIDTPPESLAAEILAAPQSSQIIGKTVGDGFALADFGGSFNWYFKPVPRLTGKQLTKTVDQF